MAKQRKKKTSQFGSRGVRAGEEKRKPTRKVRDITVRRKIDQAKREVSAICNCPLVVVQKSEGKHFLTRQETFKTDWVSLSSMIDDYLTRDGQINEATFPELHAKHDLINETWIACTEAIEQIERLPLGTKDLISIGQNNWVETGKILKLLRKLAEHYDSTGLVTRRINLGGAGSLYHMLLDVQGKRKKKR